MTPIGICLAVVSDGVGAAGHCLLLLSSIGGENTGGCNRKVGGESTRAGGVWGAVDERGEGGKGRRSSGRVRFAGSAKRQAKLLAELGVESKRKNVLGLAVSGASHESGLPTTGENWLKNK